MISTLVIVGLVVVWAVVLLPDLLAKLSRVRRSDTIRSFNTQLSSLGRSAPVRADDNVIDLRAKRSAPRRGVRSAALVLPAPPVSSAPSGAFSPHPSSLAGPKPVSPAMRKRRQDVLVALGAAALLSLLATVAFGGPFLYVHLIADLLMAAYLIALQRVIATQASAGAALAHARVSTERVVVSKLAPQSLAPRPLVPQRIAN